jgi:hypothetical protein
LVSFDVLRSDGVHAGHAASEQKWQVLAGWRMIGSGSGSGLEHAAAHLVELHGLEQGLEIALAKAAIALALDELEEDGPSWFR